MRDRRGKEEEGRGEAAVPCPGLGTPHTDPATAPAWHGCPGVQEKGRKSSGLELGHPRLGGSQQLAEDAPMLLGWPARAEISKRTEITPLSHGKRWRLLLKVFSAVVCNQHFE